MDQTRVTQLLPWRCVLEMGNAKYNHHQSSAYRQCFKETKTKRERVILRKLAFLGRGFLDICWYFGIFEFLIRPTNIQSTQNWVFLDMWWANPEARPKEKLQTLDMTGPQTAPSHRSPKKPTAMVVMLLCRCVVHLSLTQPTHWCHQKGQKNYWMNLVNHSPSDLNASNKQKRGNIQDLLRPPLNIAKAGGSNHF